jgi:putative membrane protein
MNTACLLTVMAFGLAASAVSAQTPGPNDAQIAAIVVAANEVDIEAGKLAQSKASNKEVKKFAQQMVNDHTAVNKAAGDLVRKLKVKPEQNPTSAGLRKAGDSTLQRLKALKGAAFDKAYIDNEVTYHQTVLDALDKTLIPSAANDQLKALLEKVRPAFAAHLEHAKQLAARKK